MIPALLFALQLAAAPSGYSEAKALADANEAVIEPLVGCYAAAGVTD